MIAHVLAATLDDEPQLVNATPRCGFDYCDRCGDCLYCYEDDPCAPGSQWHTWVVYPSQADEFWAYHSPGGTSE